MTRRRHYLLAFLLLAASFGVAHAVTQDINLTATVPSTCSISDSQSPAATTQSLTIDGTGRVSTTPVSLSFPVVCNRAATLELATTGRGLAGPAAVSGYDSRIHYTAVTSGVFPAVTYNTAVTAPDLPGGGSSYVTSSTGAAAGTLSISITPAASTNPLAPGVYTDTLRLIILPTQ